MPHASPARLAGLVCCLALLAACSPDGAGPTPAEDTPTVPSATPAPADPADPTTDPTPAPEPPGRSTPLHDAVAGGAASRTEVRVLLAQGADVTPTDSEDRTAEDLARELGHDRLAALLARADERVAEPDAALPRAASAGDADVVALAMRSGARVDVRDARRRTPLLRAVIDDRLEVAGLLARLGADPDAVDVQQDTPWLVTGVTGSVAMGRLLLPLDPDVTLRNRYGGVSTIPASERGHVAYVRWALQHTAVDVDHVNDLGWTALLEAVILGEGTERWQRVVGILLAHGADRDLPDRDGVTALQHARSRGYDEIAALLSR